MRRWRVSKLPKETGGLLIGSFDTSRKIIFLNDFIPAPIDSVENPTEFTRGKEGVLQTLDTIRERTIDRLRYIGEWHSHPAGAAATTSGKDLIAIAQLAGVMQRDGLPSVMLILGDSGYSLNLGHEYED